MRREDCYNTATGTIEGNRISLGGISGENGGRIKSSYNLASLSDKVNDGFEYCNPGTGDATPLLDSSLPKIYYYGEKYSNSNCSHENMDEITGFCEGCGTYNGRPENGKGTLESPYELSNSKHLYWFSALIRGQENELLNSSAHAKLTDDIVVNSETMSEQSTNPVAWIPIGTSEAHFKGSIDGQGYTVSGLYFNDDTKPNIGLVGYGGSGVSVKDITIANTYFKGSSNIGAICGSAARETGGITSEFTRCETLESVIVSGKSSSVGGIVGSLKGEASNCKNAAIVTSYAGAGGITGYAIVSDIIGCENSGVINTTGWTTYEMPAYPGQSTYGDFTGGIVGATSDNIEIINCYNTGEVTSLAIIGTTYSGVGGIVGSVRGDVEGRRCGSVKQCHNIGVVTGIDRVGGLVGNYSEGILAGLANSFSLEGKAEKAIGTGVPMSADNVGIKTEEEFRDSSLIGFLNISDPIWEQGLT